MIPSPARRVLAALPLLALAAGCAPSPDARLAEHELMAREILAAWQAGDTEEIVDHFRPGAVYDDFPNGTTYRGLDEIQAYKAEIHEWASDVTVSVTAVHPSPRGAVAEWVLHGVQTGILAGRADVATDREFLLNGVTVLEVEGGAVTRAADYLDTLPLMLQIGARVQLPGGEVLELEGAGP